MSNPILWALPDTIRTDRLTLRVPRAGDGAAVCAAVTDSLSQLRSFLASLPWVAADPSVAASELWCRTAQANFLARTDMPFLVFDRASERLVGVTGLHRVVWSTPKAEIGYWGRTGTSGQGYIGEAVRAATAYAFEHLGAIRVELITDEDNSRSRRVAERCGFELEGILKRERRAPDGSVRNTCVYARWPTESLGLAGPGGPDTSP